jgi:hypothetical protein
MPDATVRTSVHTRGNVDLRAISRNLREMDDRKVKDLFRQHLEPAARRFVPPVRAAVLAIPTTGEKHTGLRARIAACAEVASWEPRGTTREVNVAVEMNPKRMPPGELGLPLYMEGVVDKGRHNRWRHPVYGRWLPNQPNQPSHPYFYRAARGFGPAARDALGRALDDITRQLNG